MPEYIEKEPHKGISYFNCWHIISIRVWNFIEKVYKHRSKHHKQKRDELIELTTKILEYIKSVITYKSKLTMKIILLKISWKSNSIT